MSHTIRFSTLRTVAAAGLLGVALSAPVTINAQTGGPGRALLNSTGSISFTPTIHPVSVPGLSSEPTAQIDGERALLGGGGTGEVQEQYLERTSDDSWVNRARVDGEEALLGKGPRAEQ